MQPALAEPPLGATNRPQNSWATPLRTGRYVVVWAVMLGMETGCSHDGCRAVAGALQVRLRLYGGLDGVGVVRRDKRPDEAAYVEDQRLPLAWPAGVQARPVAGVRGAPDPSPASRGA